MNEFKRAEILMVEDNPADFALVREALAECRLLNRLTQCQNGHEALAYLNRQGHYADASRPDLILLDLNMPRMDGRELLQQLKADPVLRRIPVIILTTSADEEDVVNSYRAHANAFITKPVNFEGFLEVVRSVEDFWLSIVALPEGEP